MKYLLICLGLFMSLGAEEIEFKSKLFTQGTLRFSDDFDQPKYKGRYGPKKNNNIKQVGDGILEVLPLSGKPKDMTVCHIYNIPKKFVCHLRFKVMKSDPNAGAAMQIGNHKMHLSGSEEAFSIFLRKTGKRLTNSEVKSFIANQWIDMIIEYQQGKMLLNINGKEIVFEGEGINMDGAQSILFKYRGADKTLFDYVRIWEAK
ncbi:hypothetical protein PQO01_09185 [Lentisphaera marina]|uniref:hypothetical protein n=1 Tax=Lentisphaera marina TaxID=1111041 RepID=UPI00236570CE|nr:hypothetical protein [Lentisphaera marina]MDD7985121.1 hypothetical protein [Lentisphaera marina]